MTAVLHEGVVRRIAKWLLSSDTGVSSKTICRVALGVKGEMAPPRDPADFGRCYRLLEKIPELRDTMSQLPKQCPDWQPLVDNWEELERMWREESPTGRAPKMYERMKELRGVEL